MKIYNLTGYLIILAYMLVCIYFAPASFGALEWRTDSRRLFHLLLVPWRVVFGRPSPFRYRPPVA